MKKRVFVALIVLLLFFSYILAFAHSGRTDKNGGHRDNKNVSGLGPYHYHCGGYPPHLHDKGYCPYTGEVFPSISFPDSFGIQSKSLADMLSTQTPKPTLKSTKKATSTPKLTQTDTPEPIKTNLNAITSSNGFAYVPEVTATPKPTLSPEEIEENMKNEFKKSERKFIALIIASVLFGPSLWALLRNAEKDT